MTVELSNITAYSIFLSMKGGLEMHRSAVKISDPSLTQFTKPGCRRNKELESCKTKQTY